MNFAQALYVLNEENYKKTYLDFQFGFNNINEEDLKITGVFAEKYENIINNYNDGLMDKAKLVILQFDLSRSKEININCGIKNDLLFGTRISDEEYEKIIEKYG